MSYHGLVRLVQNKECYFVFSYTFFFPFLLFSIKRFALLSLLLFLFLRKYLIFAIDFGPITNWNWFLEMSLELHVISTSVPVY